MFHTKFVFGQEFATRKTMSGLLSKFREENSKAQKIGLSEEPCESDL